MNFAKYRCFTVPMKPIHYKLEGGGEGVEDVY